MGSGLVKNRVREDTTYDAAFAGKENIILFMRLLDFSAISAISAYLCVNGGCTNLERRVWSERRRDRRDRRVQRYAEFTEKTKTVAPPDFSCKARRPKSKQYGAALQGHLREFRLLKG